MKTIKMVFKVSLFLFALAFSVNAQDSLKSPEIFSEADEMPEFKGGQEALVKYMIAHIVYPEEAKKKGIQGKVFVSFVVDEGGKILSSKTERSASHDLDQEALRVINGMPDWIPGKKDGKPVKVRITLPVMFALESEKNS